MLLSIFLHPTPSPFMAKYVFVSHACMIHSSTFTSRLQDGVKETIVSLREAGIKVI